MSYKNWERTMILGENMIKLCRECKWPANRESALGLRCVHPMVNSRDPWALAASEGSPVGTCARFERSRGWFAPCGMKGKLWER